MKPNVILRYSDGRVLETRIPTDSLLGASILIEGDHLFIYVQGTTPLPAVFIETTPVKITINNNIPRNYIGQPKE